MGRRNFLKSLGTAALGIAVLPMSAIDFKTYDAEIITEKRNLKEDFLNLVFNNKKIEPITDCIFIRLYDKEGLEAKYPNYIEGGICTFRTSEYWKVKDNICSNAIPISFPCNTTDYIDIIYGFALTDSLGSILFSGELSAPAIIDKGTVPKFYIGDLIIKET